ncbi:MAG: hypothetical protein V1719_00285 [Patescibacteria group bacterium]
MIPVTDINRDGTKRPLSVALLKDYEVILDLTRGFDYGGLLRQLSERQYFPGTSKSRPPVLPVRIPVSLWMDFRYPASSSSSKRVMVERFLDVTFISAIFRDQLQPIGYEVPWFDKQIKVKDVSPTDSEPNWYVRGVVNLTGDVLDFDRDPQAGYKEITIIFSKISRSFVLIRASSVRFRALCIADLVGLNKGIANALNAANIDIQSLGDMITNGTLENVPGIGKKSVEAIKNSINELMRG